jgi:hypothetical protein
MDRQAGMTKIIIAFCNFAHAPENCSQTAGCMWAPASLFQSALKKHTHMFYFQKQLFNKEIFVSFPQLG